MPTLRSNSAKGKAKADPRQPLLGEDTDNNHYGSTSQPSQDAAQRTRSPATPSIPLHRAWRSHLLTGALAFLTLLLGGALAAILLADSYAAPALRRINGALAANSSASDAFWKEAVIVRGPDSIKMSGLGRRKDDAGKEHLELNLTVAVRMAVDTDFVMDLRQSDEDSWFTERWKSIGRWGVGSLGSITTLMDDIVIYPANMTKDTPILTLKARSPIPVPLRPGLTKADHRNTPYLQTVSIPFTVSPSQNTTLILDFLKKSWIHGFANVRVYAPELTVYGGGPDSRSVTWWKFGQWRKWLKVDKSNIFVPLRLQIPRFSLPNFPPMEPGSDLPNIADLLVLEAFKISSQSDSISPNDFPSSKPSLSSLASNSHSLKYLEHASITPSLLVTAFASLPHPFGSLVSKIDLGNQASSLPFIVSLPVPDTPSFQTSNIAEAIPVVAVSASPEFNETHIRIHLSGHVLPFSDAPDSLPDAISAFVSSYLSYKSSLISVSTPLYPPMQVIAKFPPPPHKLELLRDVRIEDMNIHAGLSFSENTELNTNMVDILASATVFARVVLPKGIDIEVSVKRLWVDCLVYDGPISN
ncbi:hypothetical protein M422DRAFT_786352, partial [Sphaerobolus stellatus SS14]